MLAALLAFGLVVGCGDDNSGGSGTPPPNGGGWNGVVFGNGAWAKELGAVTLFGVEPDDDDDPFVPGGVTITGNKLVSGSDMIAAFFENPVDASKFTKLIFEGAANGMFAWWYGGIIFFENPDDKNKIDEAFEAQWWDGENQEASNKIATFLHSNFADMEYDDEPKGKSTFNKVVGFMIKNCTDDLELIKIHFE